MQHDPCSACWMTSWLPSAQAHCKQPYHFMLPTLQRAHILHLPCMASLAGPAVELCPRSSRPCCCLQELPAAHLWDSDEEDRLCRAPAGPGEKDWLLLLCPKPAGEASRAKGDITLLPPRPSGTVSRANLTALGVADGLCMLPLLSPTWQDQPATSASRTDPMCCCVCCSCCCVHSAGCCCG